MTVIVLTATRILAVLAEFVLIPMGLGRLLFCKGERDTGLMFLCGLFAELCIFEVIYLPFFFIGLTFSLLTAVYHIVVVPLTIGGFLLYRKHNEPVRRGKTSLSKNEKCALAVFFAVLLYQLARVTFGAGTWNVDDGWYLALANCAIESDSILRNDILTGYAYDYSQHIAQNMEYVFSPWPLFWAMTARISQLDITVLMRTVLPAPFIIVFYYVVYRIMKLVLNNDREKTFTAMAMIAVFFELSGVAMNIKYTWILCYPWMGKGFGPSVICPAVLLFFLTLEEESDRKRRLRLWICVFLGNLAGCVAASSCAEINLIVLGCWGLAHVIRKRSLSVIPKLAAAVLPSLALMLAHLAA